MMGLFSSSKPKSVASITAKLNDTVAELEAHADDQQAQADEYRTAVAVARANEVAAVREHELAKRVAGNIRSLLE